jgi:hypothetical protein
MHFPAKVLSSDKTHGELTLLTLAILLIIQGHIKLQFNKGNSKIYLGNHANVFSLQSTHR